MTALSKIGPLPRWDLSNVYTGLESKDLRIDIEKLESSIECLDAFLDDNHIAKDGQLPRDEHSLAALIGGYLNRTNIILRLYGTLRSYVHSYVSTDSYNTVAKRLASELDMLGIRLRHHDVLFRGWLGIVAADSGMLDLAIEKDKFVHAHSFYLKEMTEQSRYLMLEGEETLGAELSHSGAEAWSKLQRVITSQLQAPFERDGQIEELPITRVQSYYNDPDGGIRRQAYEVELKAWEGVREPLAACLNGVKGTVNTLDRRRGRSDALHEALDLARIDRETLEVMLGAMQDSLPAFRRYWQAKANRLGLEHLPWWDLRAPLAASAKTFTFIEAAEFILTHFGSFSDELVDFSRRAFDNNWIDAESRDGKVGGGFCMSLPGVEESRILCNFDGSFGQLGTIAHELGHAYHNESLKGRSLLLRRTPMTMAETASIFCQTIITDAMLAEAGNPEEEISILEGFLIGSSQVIVDISSRYLFEKEVFERRESSELSADDFCDIMVRAQKATYGDGLDQRYLHPYMWTWKPHYYRPTLSFYNFPYAFGLLFGLGLFKIYKEGQPDFVVAYNDLLASTGIGTPAELANRFGIDLRKPSFWQSSLHVIEERIDRYNSL